MSYIFCFLNSCRGWTISGTPLDLRDPRVLAMAEAERHFLEAEYDEYAASNASGAAFCRSAALIVSPEIIEPLKKDLQTDCKKKKEKNRSFDFPSISQNAKLVIAKILIIVSLCFNTGKWSYTLMASWKVV